MMTMRSKCYSHSFKKPALRRFQNASESASAGSLRTICNSFSLVEVVSFEAVPQKPRVWQGELKSPVDLVRSYRRSLNNPAWMEKIQNNRREEPLIYGPVSQKRTVAMVVGEVEAIALGIGPVASTRGLQNCRSESSETCAHRSDRLSIFPTGGWRF